MPKVGKEIRAKEVRLVDQNGNMVGVVPIEQALRAAKEVELDLVEIAPQSVPPVCKILDFSKYRYELRKKTQESKKKQKVIQLKELKFRPTIAENDFNVKLKSIKKFIEHGDKVKITLWFKGREIVHQEIGMNLLRRIIEETSEYAKPELEPKLEGKQLMMILIPVAQPKK